MSEEQGPRELDIERILKAIEDSGAEEVHVEAGSLVIRYSRTGRISTTTRPGSESAPSAPVTGATPPPAERLASPVPDASVVAPTAPAAETQEEPQGSWVAVSAPIAGVFYHRPKPGEPPFVAVGDQVAADDPIGLVEVMKLMNTVVAAVAGTVREVVVPDGSAVGYGDALVWIEPDA